MQSPDFVLIFSNSFVELCKLYAALQTPLKYLSNPRKFEESEKGNQIVNACTKYFRADNSIHSSCDELEIFSIQHPRLPSLPPLATELN